MIRISSLEKLIGAFVMFIFCMLIIRIFYSGNYRYIFLLWNIFLAWIPFYVSKALVKQKNICWRSALLFITWLLFFPNALYIVTDLMHLEVKTDVPVWYDVILLFTSASTGLIMAFASLYRVEKFLENKMGRLTINTTIVFCLFLGSFGVYLGRFLRLNSWNIISHPFRVFFINYKAIYFSIELYTCVGFHVYFCRVYLPVILLNKIFHFK